MTKKEVAKFIEKIDQTFPIDKILELNTDNLAITDYYSKTNFFYRKMHSEQGAIHFPVHTKDANSHADKLLFQAKTVGEIIEKTGAQRVLELGCGMGFNSIFLANKYTDCQFWGLDLTPKHIHLANKYRGNLSNITFQEGDFDKLDLSEKYDLIFAVETLCHSKKLLKVLTDASHILTSKGKIVVFDGYGTTKIETEAQQDEFLKTVAALFAKGFVIQAPQLLSFYSDISKQTELNVEEIEDLSDGILPNFKRFQKGAALLFKYPWVTRILMKLKIVPTSLFLHGLAGLLGPFLLENKYTRYVKVVLRK